LAGYHLRTTLLDVLTFFLMASHARKGLSRIWMKQLDIVLYLPMENQRETTMAWIQTSLMIEKNQN